MIKLGKEKGLEIINEWIKSCTYYLYWSATSTVNEDGNVVLAKYMILCQIVVDVLPTTPGITTLLFLVGPYPISVQKWTIWYRLLISWFQGKPLFQMTKISLLYNNHFVVSAFIIFHIIVDEVVQQITKVKAKPLCTACKQYMMDHKHVAHCPKNK